MKTLLCLVLSGALTASGAIISGSWSSFSQGTIVPDGDPNGWQDTRSLVVTSGEVIGGIQVDLNVTGGFNGDIYARLTHGTDFAVLLNRPGVTSGNADGYADSGFNVEFDDAGATTHDIHLYGNWVNPNGGVLSGSWWSDGRDVDPGSVQDTDARTRTLLDFQGINPDGNWTLFLADLSSGEEMTVNSWGLSVSLTSVPEPSQVAGLAVVAMAAVAAGLYYRRRSPAGPKLTAPGSNGSRRQTPVAGGQ